MVKVGNMKVVGKWLLRCLFWLPLIWVALEGLCMLELDGAEALPPTLPNSKEMPFDPITLWKLNPGSFTAGGIEYNINASGRRVTTARNTETVVFVGDSSTFGFGVPTGDSLPEQSAMCSGYNPVNAAVSGYSSSQIVAQLPALLQATTPKWVVVGLPWSDFMHSTVSDEKRLERAGAVGRVLRIIEHPVVRRSFIAQWLLLKAEESRRSTPIELDPDSILDPNSTGLVRRVSSEKHLNNVQRITKISHRKGVRLVLIHLPRNPRAPGPGNSLIRSYRDPVRQWSEEQNVPLVEGNRLLEALPLEHQARHFVDDIHPSKLGHKRLAAALCSYLNQRP